MALVPVTEAASLVSVDPAALYRDVDSGRLQATRTADGDILLDTAELQRIYGKDEGEAPSSLSPEKVRIAMLEERTRALERALALEAELRKTKDQVANELRARLADKESEIRTLQNKVMFLETDKPEPIPTLGADDGETAAGSEEEHEEQRHMASGWWSRLLGKRKGSSLTG